MISAFMAASGASACRRRHRARRRPAVRIATLPAAKNAAAQTADARARIGPWLERNIIMRKPVGECHLNFADGCAIEESILVCRYSLVTSGFGALPFRDAAHRLAYRMPEPVIAPRLRSIGRLMEIVHDDRRT
jgi:hypothetical protein